VIAGFPGRGRHWVRSGANDRDQEAAVVSAHLSRVLGCRPRGSIRVQWRGYAAKVAAGAVLATWLVAVGLGGSMMARWITRTRRRGAQTSQGFLLS
jgi:hypothetical protein